MPNIVVDRDQDGNEQRHVTVDDEKWLLVQTATTGEWWIYRDVELPLDDDESMHLATLQAVDERQVVLDRPLDVVNVDLHGDVRANIRLASRVARAAGLRVRATKDELCEALDEATRTSVREAILRSEWATRVQDWPRLIAFVDEDKGEGGVAIMQRDTVVVDWSRKGGEFEQLAWDARNRYCHHAEMLVARLLDDGSIRLAMVRISEGSIPSQQRSVDAGRHGRN